MLFQQTENSNSSQKLEGYVLSFFVAKKTPFFLKQFFQLFFEPRLFNKMPNQLQNEKNIWNWLHSQLGELEKNTEKKKGKKILTTKRCSVQFKIR